MSLELDEHFMRLALAQAHEADRKGEVPVGAVLVHNGQVIAAQHNAPVALHDPSAHAEVLALRSAAQARGNYRLDGCTLYVTLEPCAMCAGAILHARLARLVFGASDPRTGMAGSQGNLFAHAQLNHQTEVTAGVLAAPCADLLAGFFRQRRQIQRAKTPLREDALRTPATRFAHLPDYPYSPCYIHDLPALSGLRLHYVDEHPAKDAAKKPALTWLCLHGPPSWSYLYRHLIGPFVAANTRVIAPDLIGFGKSDKPKKAHTHRFGWHRQILLEFIERLDLHNVVLVLQGSAVLLGLSLPLAAAHRYRGLLLIDPLLTAPTGPGPSGLLPCPTPPSQDCAAAEHAPFPDAGHRAALQAFATHIPARWSEDGAAITEQATHFWQHHWRGQSLIITASPPPALGAVANPAQALQRTIAHCPPPVRLSPAQSPLTEHGPTIAHLACTHFLSADPPASTPPAAR